MHPQIAALILFVVVNLYMLLERYIAVHNAPLVALVFALTAFVLCSYKLFRIAGAAFIAALGAFLYSVLMILT